MIKIFGKMRYHWQPELSWSVIYWSLALLPLFTGLSLLYERVRLSLFIMLLFAVFTVMTLVGFRRYFILEDTHLYVATVYPFGNKKIPIQSIRKVLVTYLSVKLVTDAHPQGKIYYMRKWPKKYFINALALHEYFQGEVELVDHLIVQDYFEEYYRN